MGMLLFSVQVNVVVFSVKDQFDKNERYKNIQRNLIENAIVFFLPATFALPGSLSLFSSFYSPF